jgi:catechol 2,3-dioxygenase-like lactoylglutathione lyase family enzyme
VLLDQARVEAVIATTELANARRFYEDRVGLRPEATHASDAEVVYALAGESKLVVYERGGALAPAHTAAHFVVPDVEAAVAELRERGVQFEEYDLPTLKTTNGVATLNGLKFAWFKDPDLNVIGIHD